MVRCCAISGAGMVGMASAGGGRNAASSAMALRARCDFGPGRAARHRGSCDGRTRSVSCSSAMRLAMSPSLWPCQSWSRLSIWAAETDCTAAAAMAGASMRTRTAGRIHLRMALPPWERLWPEAPWRGSACGELCRPRRWLVDTAIVCRSWFERAVLLQNGSGLTLIPEFAHHATNSFRAGLKAGFFLHAQRNGQGRLDAAAAHDARQAQAHVLYSAEAAQLPAYRQHAPLVVEDGFENIGDRQADGVVGGSLSLDNLVCGVLHVAQDLVLVGGGQGAVAGYAPLSQGDGADGRARPKRVFGG